MNKVIFSYVGTVGGLREALRAAIQAQEQLKKTA